MFGKENDDMILTPKTLALLGTLEEIESLYTRISLIWDCISSNYFKTDFRDDDFRNILSELSGRKIEKSSNSPNYLSGIWYKKVVTEHLNKHLDLYSLYGEYPLYPNNDDLRYDNFRIIKKARSNQAFTPHEFLQSKLCSPQEFLRELEDLIVRKNCYMSKKITGIELSTDSVRQKFRNILTNKVGGLIDIEEVSTMPSKKESRKSEWLFTTKRLVALGIHDEIRSLYIQLCDIAKSYKESPPFASDKNFFYKYGSFKERILYKKNLNLFLYHHSAFFYDHPLYLNDDILRNGCAGMSMFAEDRNAINMHHAEKLITFTTFQKYLHHILLTILVKTRRRHGEDIYRDDVYWDLKERLDKIIADTDYKSSILNIEHIQYDLTVGSKTIWVYVNFHNLTCNQCEPRHSIVPKIVSVKPLNGEHRCNLHVNYCEDCKEYFIGKHSLAIAQKEYGTLLARLHSCSPKQCSDITWSEFNSESELHSCGYRVGESGLSFIDRRNLLIKLLDTGVMDKFSIRRDISKAISIFENNPLQVNAVQDWYEDLEFIDGYGSDEYVGEAHLKQTVRGNNNG